MDIERVSTGVPELDKLLRGGIPKNFFVAVTGEPGTGKTILLLHFIAKGIGIGDKCIYITTEESRESIIRQASQFKWDFQDAINKGNLVIIDALMRPIEDEYSLNRLDIEELVNKVIEIKKRFGYGHCRLAIDSLSAFWLDKPAMARKYSYFIKKVLNRWNMTIVATSQYAITTSDAFGFGVEHIADGIIRFRRAIRNGVLKRYLIIEKMRQTPHDLHLWEIEIVDGVGLKIVRPAIERAEDYALPTHVKRRIIRAREEKDSEIP
ncbi:KaiC domain-containing protein [Candidatus Geothermarchaeota archaeon]|nr:MAG: KaiC domain-containing protein [Candidatus Geothermarchaeota archaeon]